MDKPEIIWEALCLDCSRRYQDHPMREVIEAEATVHKMMTGHSIAIHGQVREVDGCKGQIAIGKVL